MHRRAFLKVSGTTAAGLAITGCLPRLSASTAPTRAAIRRPLNLVPVDASWERVIRTTVGLRPYRDSGFVVADERMDDKTVIHNYGHGGAGLSLSWGTGYLATELALAHTDRRAAVIGCGIVGLTAARQLQRHGFDVTIYAKALSPETTSNMSWAGFTPLSGLVATNKRTPQWDAQFRRAVEIAYREHQLLVGSGRGVFWVDEYFTMTTPSPAPGGESSLEAGMGGEPLLPPSVSVARTVLGPGEHPFSSPYAGRVPAMRFEPGIYLDALMRDVTAFGGRIVVRSFDSRQDLMALPERVIVNCTGLGAKTLFGDEELTPIKGQLTVLVPQPEVNYSIAGMTPRSDGIVLGHISQKRVWSMDVDEDARKKVVDRAIAFFRSMKAPVL
ncbi:MAG TPA: FAD-dependent oxidoreductase [Gemmatimonadaceae bacterium]|nr:FAD-dependent oxidoreductase [Gemmatimonadaceae bacterium]